MSVPHVIGLMEDVHHWTLMQGAKVRSTVRDGCRPSIIGLIYDVNYKLIEHIAMDLIWILVGRLNCWRESC